MFAFNIMLDWMENLTFVKKNNWTHAKEKSRKYIEN
jgi:hypothetical protein